jgi:chemotaxis protein MotA
MDVATIIGLFGGVAMVIIGVISGGGRAGDIWNLASIFVTVGGSYCALFIAFPLHEVLGVWKIMGRCFKVFDYGEKSTVQNMVALSEKARREGILALEEGLDDLDDKFLREGLRLMVVIDFQLRSASRGNQEGTQICKESFHAYSGL